MLCNSWSKFAAAGPLMRIKNFFLDALFYGI